MEHIRDILIKMGYLPDEKQLKEYVNRINDLEYQVLEFMKITGFTLEQFKQLYLSGTIRLDTYKDVNIYEVHRAIKTFGLQYTIDALRGRPEPLTELREVLNNEKGRKKGIK